MTRKLDRYPSVVFPRIWDSFAQHHQDLLYYSIQRNHVEFVEVATRRARRYTIAYFLMRLNHFETTKLSNFERLFLK